MCLTQNCIYCHFHDRPICVLDMFDIQTCMAGRESFYPCTEKSGQLLGPCVCNQMFPEDMHVKDHISEA